MGVRSALLDLLFPPKCAFCRGILPWGERNICAGCKENLPFLAEEDILQPGESYSLCVSPLYYEDQVRDSIHRYKFQGARCYRHPYAELMVPCIESQLAGRYDIISWVPVSRARLRQRGYDQAKILAQAIGGRLDIVPLGTLKKTKHTRAQSALGGKDVRSANISGAYAVICPALISGKRILLIDDVVTTGSTLTESAHCLLQAGAQEVLAATLARASEQEMAPV